MKYLILLFLFNIALFADSVKNDLEVKLILSKDNLIHVEGVNKSDVLKDNKLLFNLIDIINNSYKPKLDYLSEKISQLEKNNAYLEKRNYENEKKFIELEKRITELEKVSNLSKTTAALSDENFKQLEALINKESFTNKKINLISLSTQNKTITCAQVAALLNYFVFDSDKVKLIQTLYHKISDKNNNLTLLDSINGIFEKNNLIAFFKKNQ